MSLEHTQSLVYESVSQKILKPCQSSVDDRFGKKSSIASGNSDPGRTERSRLQGLLFFFRARFTSFHTHFSILTFFCSYVIFHFCCFYTRVFEKTLLFEKTLFIIIKTSSIFPVQIPILWVTGACCQNFTPRMSRLWLARIETPEKIKSPWGGLKILDPQTTKASFPYDSVSCTSDCTTPES